MLLYTYNIYIMYIILYIYILYMFTIVHRWMMMNVWIDRLGKKERKNERKKEMCAVHSY